MIYLLLSLSPLTMNLIIKLKILKAKAPLAALILNGSKPTPPD